MKSEKMKLFVEAKAKNESFARAVVGAFASRMNPTLEQLSDIQMGFTIMEAFMDEVLVSSLPGMGTSVQMIKHLKPGDDASDC